MAAFNPTTLKALTELAQSERTEQHRREMVKRLCEQVAAAERALIEKRSSESLGQELKDLRRLQEVIRAIGAPQVPRNLQEVHRAGRFLHLAKITGNLSVDYRSHFSAAGDFIRMAGERTSADEAVRDMRQARYHLDKLLLTDSAFIDAEEALREELTKAA